MYKVYIYANNFYNYKKKSEEVKFKCKSGYVGF